MTWVARRLPRGLLKTRYACVEEMEENNAFGRGETSGDSNMDGLLLWSLIPHYK